MIGRHFGLCGLGHAFCEYGVWSQMTEEDIEIFEVLCTGFVMQLDVPMRYGQAHARIGV